MTTLEERLTALVRSEEADKFRDEACRGTVGLPYANNRYVHLLDDARALLDTAAAPQPETPERCEACGLEVRYCPHGQDAQPSAAAHDEPTIEDGEGLHRKYHVERLNDPDGKHRDCRYFVLDPVHDLIARQALGFYAQHAKRLGYPDLAADLREWIEAIDPADTPFLTDSAGGAR